MNIRKQSRKIRWWRLLVLILPVCLLIGAIGFGLYYVFTYSDRQINAVAQPDTISQETFEALKTKALDNHGAYETLFLNIQEYPQDVLDFLLADEDRLDFVLHYPQRDQYASGPDSLKESLSEIPTLYQWDLRWGYVVYGEGYLYETGCAPTCLSMVLSYLCQDASITPNALAQYAQNQGFYVNGAGTDWQFLTDVAENHGVQVERITPDQTSVDAQLSQHKILVLSMLPGDFTQVGHFIVVYGMQDGKYLIHDPNSHVHTQEAWDPQTILSQTQSIWAYTK